MTRSGSAMVVGDAMAKDPHLSVSLSPLLPSSMEDDEHAGRKRVHFEQDNVPFQPTHTVFTPRLTDTASLRYRTPDDRVDRSKILAPPTSVSSIAQPNYDDFLRRVSVVLYQHLRRCEKLHREQQRAAGVAASQSGASSSMATANGSSASASHAQTDDGSSASKTTGSQYADSSGVSFGDANHPGGIASPKLIDLPVDELFREEHFVTPQFKYTYIRLPRVHPMTSYAMEKITSKCHVPSVDEIFRFCKNLFNKAQLSAECTIVCLIYIERLMEQASVPLLAATWKPIVLCGLLLASKVWQDLSSWNVEISNIYPQYPLHSINRLERLFLHHIQWDLYISASVYAKYYFALRSLTEKKDFRRRYNYTMRVDPPNSRRLEERSAAIKHELYSKSL
ncbi:TPA: hypothetical protein N0F65_009169 [Lagenidium giganteum]|uniref:Cyclin N-terminal domain-containing protein n=1 Tax=Lagenidium giganteum TaxID=4803 RepID=A0AAV2YTZ0_9STRA|nr:TPA: hypothetical protein N0F65_009169 [Lagenidium giganteum]